MLEEKKNKMLQLQKELDDQKVKLDRVSKQNSKLSRDIRSATGSKGELPEEVYFSSLNSTSLSSRSSSATVIACRKTWSFES